MDEPCHVNDLGRSGGSVPLEKRQRVAGSRRFRYCLPTRCRFVAGRRDIGTSRKAGNLMLTANGSLLLVVDIQAGLVRVVEEASRRVSRTKFLLEAAERLAVPVIVSEQYPEGLGPTDRRLAPLLDRAQVFGKRAFSCWREPVLRRAIEASGRRQVVVCGMETHVCVLQTALDLAKAGFMTCAAADAVGSRRAEDRMLALERMRGHGVAVVTSEMVVFEWLERGEGEAFKALIPLIKESGEVPD
jgi:nicotinamidase-related amidase